MFATPIALTAAVAAAWLPAVSSAPLVVAGINIPALASVSVDLLPSAVVPPTLAPSAIIPQAQLVSLCAAIGLFPLAGAIPAGPPVTVPSAVVPPIVLPSM